MRAIIISGMPAAGKTTVAKILSKELGLKMVGAGDFLKEMAKDRGYIPGGDDWWDTAEGIRFMRERETNPDFDKEVDARLLKKLEQGNVIATSYTAPWISKSGFKVWLKAESKSRAERMAKRDNTGLKQTIKTTKIRDVENYRIYKGLYNMEFGKDLSPFDLIVDTDGIAPEEVARIILNKLKELKELGA
ncbi:MAG: AAA family ATPase [Candidatus Marsarchaeota archaeon]|jgi:cytidylate kinase, putative|nr:AAA family ATPase [Candidatus Marsarchaeota archaeon]